MARQLIVPAAIAWPMVKFITQAEAQKDDRRIGQAFLAESIKRQRYAMPHPVRAMYLFLQMPQNTFLALAIYSASTPLYAHYANLGLLVGPGYARRPAARRRPHVDHRRPRVREPRSRPLPSLGWMRFEERDTSVRRAVRTDAEMAVIHAREVVLADRLASERSVAGGAEAAPTAAPVSRPNPPDFQ